MPWLKTKHLTRFSPSTEVRMVVPEVGEVIQKLLKLLRFLWLQLVAC